MRKNIADALNYWGASMRSILPKSMQSSLLVGEEELIVCIDKDKIRLEKNVNGNITSLASLPRTGDVFEQELTGLVKKHLNRDYDLLLLVDDEMVLTKQLDFPLAAAENLSQVVWYEMDKHTPFPKESVLFDTSIEKRHATKLQARLYLLHRSQVDSILTVFSLAKIRFDRIASVSQKNINLLPEALCRKRAILPYKRNIFFATVLLSLLVVLLASPLYFKRDVAMKLDAQIATLNNQALGEGELWSQRDEDERILLEFIEAYPIPFAQIYEELSKCLPDDTWVQNMIYYKGKVTISGEGDDVASLIKKINKVPLFKNARLLSPIVKSRHGSDKEVYNISFDTVITTNGGAQ